MPDEADAHAATPGTDEARHTRTLEHAKVAYANAQDVIKFVDLKSNVLIALSTVVSGFALALVKWNFELPAASPARVSALLKLHPFASWLLLLCFALSLISTVASYVATAWSMIVRSAKKGAFTILFPVPRDLSEKEHRRLVAERMAGMSREGIRHEFSEQLFAVGQILQSKQLSSRIAAIAVIVQITLLTIAVLCYLCLAASI